MTLTDRLAGAALAMGFAAGAPTPHASAPRFVWRIAQDAGVPDAAPASAGDAGATADRAAELVRALRDYEEAHQRRKDSQP
jgi:hypothetical protein